MIGEAGDTGFRQHAQQHFHAIPSPCEHVVGTGVVMIVGTGVVVGSGDGRGVAPVAVVGWGERGLRRVEESDVIRGVVVR